MGIWRPGQDGRASTLSARWFYVVRRRVLCYRPAPHAESTAQDGERGHQINGANLAGFCARRRAGRRAETRRRAAARRRRRGRASPAPPSRSELFGVAAGGAIHNEAPATLGRDLNAIQQLHAAWLRVDINWATIQDHGPA